MSNKNNDFNALLAIAGVIVAGYYVLDYLETKCANKALKSQNQQLQNLIGLIQESAQFSAQVKEKLQQMIYEFQYTDPDVAQELRNALQKLQIQQTEAAIMDLAKIMEHILKNKYQQKLTFITWLKAKKSQLSLYNLLAFAKDQEDITEIEMSFYLSLKKLRNQQAHEINQFNDPYINAAGLLAGIGAIMKLAKKSIVNPY